MLNTRENYEILTEIANNLSKNPNTVFYLDEPFMNYDRLNDIHTKIRNLISGKYIEDFDFIDEGMSKKYPLVPRLGFKFRFLPNGINLLKSPLSPQS